MSDMDIVVIRFLDGTEFKYYRHSLSANAPGTIFDHHFSPDSPFNACASSLPTTYTLDRDVTIFKDFIDPFLRGYGKVWKVPGISPKSQMMLDRDLEFYGIIDDSDTTFQSFTQANLIFKEAFKAKFPSAYRLGPFHFKTVNVSAYYDLKPHPHNGVNVSTPFRGKDVDHIVEDPDNREITYTFNDSDESKFLKTMYDSFCPDDEWNLTEHLTVLVDGLDITETILGAIRSKQGVPALGLSSYKMCSFTWDDSKYLQLDLSDFVAYLDIIGWSKYLNKYIVEWTLHYGAVTPSTATCSRPHFKTLKDFLAKTTV